MNNNNTQKSIAVMVSGGGRSLENLLKTQINSNYQIKTVVASNSSCKALEIAKRHKVEVLVLDFADPSAIEEELYQWFSQHKVELIVLAGFLKKIPIKAKWTDKIINIHPALLPKYGGKGMYGDKVHQAVLKAKEQLTGATIHFVNAVYDDGKIIAQSNVSIAKNETPESLAKKVFQSECMLLPAAINEILSHKLPLTGNQIKVFK